MSHRYPAVLAAVIGATLLIGCAENRVVDTPTSSVASSNATLAIDRLAEARSDSLAHGLALALGDADVRRQLRDNLRDSPFRLHALHLSSYLDGVAGRIIAAKAASALGIPADAFLRIAQSTPDLELVMPRMLDRVSWEGDAELDVAAVTMTLRERIQAGRVSEPGYDLKGNPVSVRTLRYSPRPYIIIRPSELSFPVGAESLRTAAPQRSRNTVSTPAEERDLMRQRGRERAAAEKAAGLTSASANLLDGSVRMTIPVCNPDIETCFPEDPPPTNVGGGGATLSSEMTKDYCYGNSPALNATTDRDNDRIHDSCELAIASRLAPLLNVGDNDGHPARQPYWAASRHPDSLNKIQIIYALAYLMDGGDWAFGFTDHQGDSEFIIIEVKNVTGSTWGITDVTLSAHFGAEEGVDPLYQSGADSYYWDDLEWPGVPYPRIWVALEKHANYRSNAVCDAGYSGFDDCSGPYVGTQIPALASRNVGNFYNLPPGSRSTSTQLKNCTLWEETPYPAFIYGTYRVGEECFWNITPDGFAGWHATNYEDAAPYRRIFSIYEF